MKRKIKFKLVYGFKPTEYHTLDTQQDLLKAYHAFINETKLILSNGIAIDNRDGLQIKRIEPDLCATMGYAHGYELRSLDYDEAAGKNRKALQYLGRVKTAVEIIHKTGQTDMLQLGTTQVIDQLAPLLEAPKDTNSNDKTK